MNSWLNAFSENSVLEYDNAMISFFSNDFLGLDADEQNEDFIKDFAKTYSKFYDLGSVLVQRTSRINRISKFGLANYSIIFGKLLYWKQIEWHIDNTEKLGIIKRNYADQRKAQRHISIRLNPKNDKTPTPKTTMYFYNGDMTGLIEFIRFKNISKINGLVPAKLKRRAKKNGKENIVWTKCRAKDTNAKVVDCFQ
jgi:hypothetical protein